MTTSAARNVSLSSQTGSTDKALTTLLVDFGGVEVFDNLLDGLNRAIPIDGRHKHDRYIYWYTR